MVDFKCWVSLGYALFISWEDKHFFSFILDKVFVVNNKRNQLKIKGIKVYSSKQSMTSCGSIKTKMYKWGLTLATLWYKIEDHQDLSPSWKWRIFTFSSTMKCKSLQIYFVSFKCLRSKHTCNTHWIAVRMHRFFRSQNIALHLPACQLNCYCSK